ncbi:hypothetical protein ACFO6V_14620 [Promicromonospora alba]|jgi:hypothetical protein|uniref:Uncharacterized protein n=1 Tax=Promicromonospora alba TaxID=1616110 RepID=A0ABV9HK38_9MICO
MSLWGPAIEAEIEYRQAEVKKAWGRQGTSGADRADRAERRTERRADRAEQIREGIAGMRPAATTTRRGLFA